jgi:2-oxoglutarate ferredoxin oxidoreductase subunit alpha
MKIQTHKDEIVKVETKYLDDADVVLVSYGSVARSTIHAVKAAREKGLKVGYLRLITIWPFPDDAVNKVAKKVNNIIVLENNMGQVVNEVKRIVGGKANVEFLPPQLIGAIHEPSYILEKLEEVCK